MQVTPTSTEREKAEIGRASAETEKLKAETEKLRAETLSLKPGLLDWIQAIGQFASGLTGVGAILALWYTVRRNAQQRETQLKRRREEEFSRLLRDTSSKDPGIRSTAADRLREFILAATSDEGIRRREDAVRRLVVALATEENAMTRWTTTKVLQAAGRSAISLIDEMYSTVIGQLVTVIGSEISKEQARGIKAMQSALLAYADLKSKILGSSVDLRKALLKCHRLSERDFSGADLTGASVWLADLWRANFTRAQLASVDAVGAYAVEATFQDAVLDDCKFGRDIDGVPLGADIAGADFRGARGLRVENFRWTNWRQARFDDRFMQQLEQAFPGEGYKREGLGRRLCGALE